MKVKLVKSKNETENTKTFYFATGSKPHYIAGQFIELYLPHQNADNRGQKRWFTLSSSPTEDYLSITTKFAGLKSSSFKKTLFGLPIGHEVEMSLPMGDFVLPKSSNIPLIFVAGGIGVTPFRSIIKYTIDTASEERDIKLLHVTKKASERPFIDVLSNLKEQFIPLQASELTAKKIIEITNPSSDHYIYLSGPEPMVEQLNKDLKDSLGTAYNIYTDFFPGYTY